MVPRTRSVRPELCFGQSDLSAFLFRKKKEIIMSNENIYRSRTLNEITDGGRILLQKAVYIEDGDTPEILQKRVMEQAEWKLLPAAINKIANEHAK